MTLRNLPRAVAYAGAGLLAASVANAQLVFTEVASPAGVRFSQESEALPEIPIGGGGVWADFNNDGRDDLFAVQAVAGCNHLYVNSGDGTFAEVPNAAGAEACTQTAHGATAADYDNDGDQDLYVTAYGKNLLFRNELAQTDQLSFTDVTDASGIGVDQVQGNSSSASWGDLNGDGYLDLVSVKHANYMPLDDDSCQPDLLYVNRRNGTFTEIAGRLGIALGGERGIPGCGLATTWSDYDNDGDQDLQIVNDFGELYVQNRLFRNDGPGGPGGWLLTDVSRRTAIDYPMFGMGIATGDLNRDGWFDYYTSDIGPNNLALNIRGRAFSEVAAFAGVLADDRQIFRSNGLVSWGNALVDFDHDADLDLIVANGGAPQDKFPGMFGETYVQLNPLYLYENTGAANGLRFVERHEVAGVTEFGYYRSIAVADYDDDGDMDFYGGPLQGDNVLYRNDSANQGNWLKVKAVGNGTTSNRDAIGARIRIQAGNVRLMREVSGGASFLSRHSLVQHFGVANLAIVDRVRVTFPSGTVVERFDVPVNQLLTVVEP